MDENFVLFVRRVGVRGAEQCGVEYALKIATKRLFSVTGMIHGWVNISFVGCRLFDLVAINKSGARIWRKNESVRGC